MFRLGIAVVTLLCCYGAVSGSIDLSRRDNPRPPSEDAKITDYPYVAEVMSSGVINFHSSGAAIISKNFVLTCGFCIEGTYAHELIVSVGSSTYEDGGMIYDVSEVILHEGYDWYKAKNDIALLKIIGEFTLGDTVKIIPMAFNTPQEGTTVYTTSWKSMLDYKELQVYHDTVINQDTCIDYYTKYYNLTKVFCSGVIGDDMNTCLSEDGSPLTANGQLVGIISTAAMGCTTWDRPRVRVDVASYRPWIAIKAGV